MMSLSLADVLFWGAAVFALAMLRLLWLSERARWAVERTKNAHRAREREFLSARRRERGDATDGFGAG
jgi:hypothetical protein